MPYLGQPTGAGEFLSHPALVTCEYRVEIAWTHPIDVRAAVSQPFSLLQIKIGNV